MARLPQSASRHGKKNAGHCVYQFFSVADFFAVFFDCFFAVFVNDVYAAGAAAAFLIQRAYAKIFFAAPNDFRVAVGAERISVGAIIKGF